MNTSAATSVLTPRPISVSVPGAHIVGERDGSGPALVQLHGLTSSCARDEALELNLAEDVPGRTRFRYDARGHGGSTGRALPQDYRWPALAEDLLALLDQVAPGERVDAIGQSMGAGTLLHAALIAPEQFRTLTLVIPPTAWETRQAQSASYLASAKLAERRGFDAFARLGALTPRPPAAPPAPVTPPDVTAELLPSILRGAAVSDFPPAEELGRIIAPTLVLAWVQDPSHPLASAYTLTDLLPHSELFVATTPQETLTWGGRTAHHIHSVS